jgi:predicted house-cleaning NTP pyrophosphatase (Maf/HAM1 superfamily)
MEAGRRIILGSSSRSRRALMHEHLGGRLAGVLAPDIDEKVQARSQCIVALYCSSSILYQIR